MTIEQKGKLIAAIVAELKLQAWIEKKPFDAGETFFVLAFRSDAELQKIAKWAGVELEAA
jgi:hypothetical protein